MKIRKEILDDFELLKKQRRELHKIPEIGFNTFDTMKLIQSYCEDKLIEFDGFSGVYYIKGEASECIAFRCDCDGLPIQEQNIHEYRASQNMHACGHDAHMAILLSTIRYFIKHPSKVSLLFIFEPAEESGAGAKHMIQKNIFEKYHIKYLFACHVYPNLNDFIGCTSKVMMAASSEVYVLVKGKSAHVAHSKYGIDAIHAMILFLAYIYELKKEIAPNIVHIGKMSGGEVMNSISSSSKCEGTIRSFSSLDLENIKTKLTQKLEEIDLEIGTKSIINFSSGYPCVINDEYLVNKVKIIAGNHFKEISPMYLSEDFSFYNEKCPCCMYLCGLRNTIDLHDSHFDLDEVDCLKAVEMNVSLVENYDEVILS